MHMALDLSSIIKYYGEKVSFADLPVPQKKALIHFMALESGDAWYYDGLNELLESFETDALDWDRLINAYDDLKGSEVFFIYDMPTVELQALIVEYSGVLSKAHKTWGDYHKEYTASPTPEHPRDERWPCIAGCPLEGIIDGWHRLHSYSRNGDVTIPLIYGA
jgi:hypothetical protein